MNPNGWSAREWSARVRGWLARARTRALGGNPRQESSPPEIPIHPGVVDPAELVRLVGRPDATILDVGSNDGSHTLLFLRLFPDATVYAFEPEPRAIERFRARVEDPRAELFETAVGAADGTTTFYRSDGAPNAEWRARRPGGWDLSGSIRRPKEHLRTAPWCRFDATLDVPVVRLDTWAASRQVKEIDLLWADVQGAEADLLAGAPQLLERTRYIYTEYSNRELYEGQVNLQRLCALLPNFRLIRRYTNDALFERHER